MISIRGIPKNQLLSALHCGARHQGIGEMMIMRDGIDAFEAMLIIDNIRESHEDQHEKFAKQEGKESADRLLGNRHRLKFDYLQGRVMKVDITGNDLDTYLYNRDNGENAAEKIIEKLREKYPDM